MGSCSSFISFPLQLAQIIGNIFPLTVYLWVPKIMHTTMIILCNFLHFSYSLPYNVTVYFLDINKKR